MILPFSRVAKTLPADVCVFGYFGQLSLTAVHSADCRFNSRLKWWIHISSIVTYSCKNSFLLCWNSCKQCSESLMHFCFGLTVSKRGTHMWTQLSHWQMFIQNGDYTIFWYLQLFCYFPQLKFIIGQKGFVEFFCVFQGQLPNFGKLCIQHHLCLFNLI